MSEFPTDQYQRMIDGEWYQAVDPAILRQKQAIRQTVAQFNRAPSRGNLKQLLARLGHAGQGCRIEAGIHIDLGKQVFLGDQVYINAGCTFLDGGEIRVGDHVLIGPGVHIYAVEHPKAPDERRAGWMRGRPVTVGTNAWVGGGAILLPGVSIGRDAIVGAGSLVTRDVPDGATVAGHPARVIS